MHSLAPALGADAGLLGAVAWLHDIGYVPDLVQTGLHGLDGARYLRDVLPRSNCVLTLRRILPGMTAKSF